jgi:Holliday junction resolvasome RuvABC endonuclease subunit
MKILSLDPSLTATGWAIVETPKVKVLASGTFRPDNVHDFAQHLLVLVIEHQPALISYEAARRDIMLYGKKGLLPGKAGFVTPNASQLVLLELQGAIIAVAAANGLVAHATAVQTWRAAILGTGQMQRDAAKAAAKQYLIRSQIHFRSVDEAEAICLGLYTATRPEIRHGGDLIG